MRYRSPKIRIHRIFQFSIFILHLLFLACGCEKSSTNPPPPAGPDTTSHHFTWQIDTLGLYSSYLLDVAIVDENNIWAVGEIHTAETDTFDSLGNWIPPYNATHWNGQQWELKRIPFIGPCSAVDYPPIRAIWAFLQDHILFTNGGAIAVHNGITTQLDCEMNSMLDGAIKKIFATDPSNVYAVGGEGTIVHYNGSNWQKLESGTTVDIQDIWGALNPQTGEYEILTIASERSQIPQARELLQIQGSTVTTLSDSGLPFNLRSIWFMPGKKYYVAGNGLYFNSAIGDPWQYDDSQPLFYKDAIRGNDENDVIIAGSFGNVSHFNGSTWRHYELPYFYGRYHAVGIKQDIIVAVGEIGGGLAIILRGIRN